MKHKKYSKRTVIAAGIILLIVVCAVLGVSTLRSIENVHSYKDNFPLPEDQRRFKEMELADALRNYDKENIVEPYVYLTDSDGEIVKAYIFILFQGKNPDSVMQSGIKSLVSEELGLDIKNIDVDYMDYESLTLYEGASR